MSTDTPLQDALSKPATLLPPQQRLEASRTSLRVAMQPQPRGPVSTARPGLLDRVKLASSSIDGALGHPVVEILRDTVRHWWRTHPWRPAIIVGAEAVNQLAVPVARKHPLRLLGAAMLAGAIVSRLRPWKWLLLSVAPALAASMVPTLISRLAKRIPVKTLIKAFGRPQDDPGEGLPAHRPVSSPAAKAQATVPMP